MKRPHTISVREAANLSGFTYYAILRGTKEGTIPCIRIGRLIRIPRAPFLRLLCIEDPDTVTGSGAITVLESPQPVTIPFRRLEFPSPDSAVLKPTRTAPRRKT